MARIKLEVAVNDSCTGVIANLCLVMQQTGRSGRVGLGNLRRCLGLSAARVHSP